MMTMGDELVQKENGRWTRYIIDRKTRKFLRDFDRGAKVKPDTFTFYPPLDESIAEGTRLS
jgi:hypothetical protein